MPTESPMDDGSQPHGVQHARQRAGRGRGKRKGMLQRTAPTAARRPATDWSSAYIAQQQAADPDIRPALDWIAAGTRPLWESVRPCSAAVRALWQQYSSLVIMDGVLHRIFHTPSGEAKYYQVIMPAELKTDFLEMVHADAAAHLKYKKCLDHIQRRAWWYSYKRDLDVFIRCCDKCNSHSRGKAPPKAELRPLITGEPASKWIIDLCGSFKASQGYKYIFTAVCPFSKYVIATPIRNKEASTCARVIVEHSVMR